MRAHLLADAYDSSDGEGPVLVLDSVPERDEAEAGPGHVQVGQGGPLGEDLLLLVRGGQREHVHVGGQGAGERRATCST